MKRTEREGKPTFRRTNNQIREIGKTDDAPFASASAHTDREADDGAISQHRIWGDTSNPFSDSVHLIHRNSPTLCAITMQYLTSYTQ